MDVEWALGEVQDFLRALEADRQTRGFNQTTDTEIRSRIPVMEAIAARLGADLYFRPRLRQAMEWKWANARESAVHMQTLLARGQELEERLGPAPAGTGIAGLHEWVRDAAATYWENDHRSVAVQRASEAINQHLQDKLGRTDVSGADLATQAFTVKPVSPDGDRPPRLRFPELDPAARDTYVSAHEGAMHYGRGCFMAIRNLATHELDELPEQVAYEQLAALSVFARMVQDAVVRPAEVREG